MDQSIGSREPGRTTLGLHCLGTGWLGTETNADDSTLASGASESMPIERNGPYPGSPDPYLVLGTAAGESLQLSNESSRLTIAFEPKVVCAPNSHKSRHPHLDTIAEFVASEYLRGHIARAS